MSAATEEAAEAAEDGRREPTRLRIPRAAFDLVVALALLGLGSWFFANAARIESIPGDPVGPDGFPRGLAAIFVVLCAAMAAGAALRAARRTTGEAVIIRRPSGVVAGMVLVVGFPAAMAAFGYYPAMAVLVPALMLAGGYRKPMGLVGCTLGFLAFSWLVFEKILHTAIN